MRTLVAKTSNTVRRPSTVIAATNRSGCRVSMICTPSNMRKSAHGPSNLRPAEKSNAYDGGVKSVLFDKTLLLNTYVFLTYIRDYQQAVRVLDAQELEAG